MWRLSPIWALTIAIAACEGMGQQAPDSAPYRILKTAKVGGEGAFDYIFADVEDRRLYVPRLGQLMVFNLDTLEPAGAIAHLAAGGATVDPKSHHGFSTTKPISMWDANTLAVIKTIDVDGRPDGIMFDPYNERVTFIKESSPSSFAVEQTLPTLAGAKTLTLDTRTNHVLTMTAEFAPPAPGAPAGPAETGRGPMVPDSFSILMVGK